ncbi:HNH endonuclease [Saccharopolyspora shandongensis]|uniref:HNH endonuclease n=1 Tax=Saccharopolyspora shandongensis TaxID=418495 RepID=UPI003448A51B
MGYADVRERDVLAAIERCNELGQQKLLDHYGFHQAQRYVLVHDGQQYDSKAIIGVAHEFRAGRALQPHEFSGGRATVQRHLTNLAFVVHERTTAPQLLLQPRGGRKDNGQKNFQRTVLDGITLEEHREPLGTDLAALEDLFPSGVAKVWGNTEPATQNPKAKALAQRRVGDRVFFYADRHFFAEAVILHLFRNAAAARSFWPPNGEGKAFEHIMALGDVRLLEPPLPAEPIVRAVSQRSTLRNLTLVATDQLTAISDLLPGTTATREATPTGMTANDLQHAVLALRPYQHPVEKWYSLHQPLTLLWAIGRLAAGRPRLCSWEEFEREVTPLLSDFSNGAPTPHYPFWHLSNTPLWDVTGITPRSGFNPTSHSLAAARAQAGLTECTYDLLKNSALRTKVVNLLRARYLSTLGDHSALLERVGLDGHATASGTDASHAARGPAQRRTRTVSQPDRDAKIAEAVKSLHDNRCQFCGTRLALAASFYSEAAHIRGLGSPHYGPDECSNVLCLCPNCHHRFDGFGIYIDDHDVIRQVADGLQIGLLRRNPNHALDDTHIRYHRNSCPIMHDTVAP